jgi:5-(carboxyamino)imidazole ribonucleotide synthase
MPTNFKLPPGGTIGIIGGGQLGRMLALAAARLGYRCHIFSPEADGPAMQVADAKTVAAYDDLAALESFASAIDVATLEFENIPVASMQHLAERVPLRPSWQALEIAQDRIAEKSFFNRIGIATAPWREVCGVKDLEEALKEIGTPAILKTTRLGYDGKGQSRIEAGTDLAAAWEKLGAEVGVLEGFVAFEREISVIVARSADGAWAAFDPVENVHKHHILDTTTAPARLSPQLTEEARSVARRSVEELGLIGLLAVEMFVTQDGRILANEMAPRPHNSGHWTIDACLTDQFEQCIRAVCGLPLGSPERHSDAVMTNLIGDDVNDWEAILREPNARLHLYGKAEARPGRKMGHVNRLFPKTKA